MRALLRVVACAVVACAGVALLVGVLTRIDMPEWARWLTLAVGLVVAVLLVAIWVVLQRLTIEEAEGSLEPPAGS